MAKKFCWRDVDLDALPIDGAPMAAVRNPHCTFFVDDAETVDLAAMGA
jgi:diaminopimelate epimerase